MNKVLKIRLGASKTRRLCIFFPVKGEGRMVRKPCERLSGHGSSPLGEESEA